MVEDKMSSRRSFLKIAGATTMMAGLAGVVGCSGGNGESPASESIA